MKTFLFSVILFFTIALNGRAQTADTTLIINFTGLEHDYGTIEQGSDGTHEFKFTNGGKTPLILSNVRSSCGCTVPSWTKEPVAPGKEGAIKVVYNTNNVGNFNKSITVNSNAKYGVVVLHIKGNVVKKKE
ncbi:MAG TPA: DUF1573 domain-containing protein [Draconibacterium sp.]|nr:DUF1573 domain-containing protein [Draconibacterium sp.]